MKYLLIVVTTLSINSWSMDKEDFWRLTARSTAIFSISMAFDGELTFDLKSKEGKHRLYVTRIFENHKTYETIITLNEEKFEKLQNKISQALKFNNYDDAEFVDGSTWCLKFTPNSASTTLCASSPNISPKERGFEGIYSLGLYLVSISNTNNELGNIY